VIALRCLAIEKELEADFKAGASAIPLLRGVEGCVHEHGGKHTPATTHPAAPPLERGVALSITLPVTFARYLVLISFYKALNNRSPFSRLKTAN
jgi:hypothetical protein